MEHASVQTLLTHLAARFNHSDGGRDVQTAVKIDRTKYHSLAFNAHHLARSEVCNEENVLSYELFRLIIGRNSTENGAVGTASVVDSELKELLTLGHFAARFHVSHADIQLLEVIESHRFLHRFGLVSYRFIGLFGGRKLVELLLNDVIFDLLEQQFGFRKLVSGLQKVGASS